MIKNGKRLVAAGYKQAAFRGKKSALEFAQALRARGYIPRYIRSSGSVTEGGYQERAYYVAGSKKLAFFKKTGLSWKVLRR